jgi:hypothetical protein
MGMIDTTAPGTPKRGDPCAYDSTDSGRYFLSTVIADGLTVIRIDNTTGANLWMANHAVGAH